MNTTTGSPVVFPPQRDYNPTRLAPAETKDIHDMLATVVARRVMLSQARALLRALGSGGLRAGDLNDSTTCPPALARRAG